MKNLLRQLYDGRNQTNETPCPQASFILGSTSDLSGHAFVEVIPANESKIGVEIYANNNLR
jgi:hypothetical protein